MDKNTKNYLEGRFGDYYRNLEPISDYYPQDYKNREWGYLTWDGDWLRHKSHFELGDDPSLLTHDNPRHVYFSASKYEDPGASTNMEDKKWISTDLVFDLDADPEHFSEISEDDSYKKALEICKSSLIDLIEILRNDFGFSDIQINFSGRRGYHIHVRDESIQNFDSDERIEVADYITGEGFDISGSFVENEDSIYSNLYPNKNNGWKTIQGMSKNSWNYNLNKILVDNIDRFVESYGDSISFDEENMKDYIKNIDNNVDPETTISDIKENYSQIQLGLIPESLEDFLSSMKSELVNSRKVDIDRPVTTDTHRLMRFPSTLHGGSGFKAMNINISNIDEFDPLVDSIPDIFGDNEIRINIDNDCTVQIGNISENYSEGEEPFVPEYVAIHLMCKGKATLNSKL
jgi:DNA primase small subunit